MKHSRVITEAYEYNFTVILEPEAEGGFCVLVPALPEVVTYGETEEEALEMATDAIRLALEVRREHNEEIPSETTSTRMRTVKLSMPA